MELAKRQSLEETVKMWDWLAKHPENGKQNYLREIKYAHNLTNNCFLCEYTLAFDKKERPNDKYHEEACHHCPIKWARYDEVNALRCCDEKSPYALWEHVDTLLRNRYRRIWAAEQVRDLAKAALAALKRDESA